MIYTQMNAREKPRKDTDPGKRERETFKWIKNEEGKKVLVHDQTIDRQDEIESYADECDIKNIVARASFDPTFATKLAAGADTGEYTDITEYPQNIHQLKAKAEEGEVMIEMAKKKMTEKTTEEAKNSEQE